MDRIDQAGERSRAWIDRTSPDALARLQQPHHTGVTLDQPRSLHHLAVEVEPDGERQLACFISRELDRFEGVPGEQIPVGRRIEARSLTVQQSLAT